MNNIKINTSYFQLEAIGGTRAFEMQILRVKRYTVMKAEIPQGGEVHLSKRETEEA